MHHFGQKNLTLSKELATELNEKDIFAIVLFIKGQAWSFNQVGKFSLFQTAT